MRQRGTLKTYLEELAIHVDAGFILEEFAIHVDAGFTGQTQSRYASNMFFDWPQDKVVSVVQKTIYRAPIKTIAVQSYTRSLLS